MVKIVLRRELEERLKSAKGKKYFPKTSATATTRLQKAYEQIAKSGQDAISKFKSMARTMNKPIYNAFAKALEKLQPTPTSPSGAPKLPTKPKTPPQGQQPAMAAAAQTVKQATTTATTSTTATTLQWYDCICFHGDDDADSTGSTKP